MPTPEHEREQLEKEAKRLGIMGHEGLRIEALREVVEGHRRVEQASAAVTEGEGDETSS